MIITLTESKWRHKQPLWQGIKQSSKESRGLSESHVARQNWTNYAQPQKHWTTASGWHGNQHPQWIVGNGVYWYTDKLYKNYTVKCCCSFAACFPATYSRFNYYLILLFWNFTLIKFIQLQNEQEVVSLPTLAQKHCKNDILPKHFCLVF